ncbi:MAG: AAA domain-containing protein [bacterium]|nr:AAA domain-containing protein [bacterium]
MPQDDVKLADELKETFDRLGDEVAHTIIGQKDVLFEIMVGLLAGGHCLLTGVPGLAKTLMVSSIAECLGLSFSRIQFTPDLMPSDITGTEVIEEDPVSRKRSFRFIPGPVFASVILADEINRTPPKTQAALLQSMQEHQVTAGRETRDLPEPFYVLATQNPIEQEGTYPLPEAQLDRFMLNVLVDYPSSDEEREIIASTTSAEVPELDMILDEEKILEFQRLVRRVPVPDNVMEAATGLIRATRPAEKVAEVVDKWVSWGVGPRAGQHLILAAKAAALLGGNYAVTGKELLRLIKPVLRHRLVLNFVAEAEGVTADKVLDDLTDSVIDI